ncbi:MAG: EVE domain-containing protein [Planctomycetes bacterium]|nr:EVE domain-containing protein [Planctomycetota bacterium]MCB9910101.1 EVE domain-containing protein [Planctomycetota bacterium]MCB9913352.1 EVE domain-containing protein [Planctomycetota bacterium]HPF14414.1 EVE domain-containing protein [Planctomycetota bacterium]
MSKPPARRFWLFKSEEDVFSWADLWKAPRRTTFWDGIRNYQARNFLRDDLAPGDGVLYYHSRCPVVGIAGVAQVSKAASPDPMQFDADSKYFDPKSDPADPRWFGVHIQAQGALPTYLSLEALKANPKLKEMALVQRGQRLSIQPVTPAEWREVLRMGGYDGPGA